MSILAAHLLPSRFRASGPPSRSEALPAPPVRAPLSSCLLLWTHRPLGFCPAGATAAGGPTRFWKSHAPRGTPDDPGARAYPLVPSSHPSNTLLPVTPTQTPAAPRATPSPCHHRGRRSHSGTLFRPTCPAPQGHRPRVSTTLPLLHDAGRLSPTKVSPGGAPRAGKGPAMYRCAG